MIIDRAILYLSANYQVNYPPRFRKRVSFSESSTPVAIVRQKAKCFQPGAPPCSKPHEHERLIINTRQVPMHATDRMFPRSWEVAKREDPLP